MSRKFLLSVLAYLLPSFPLGFVWHLTTFKAQYDRLEILREPVLIPLGLASMVVQAVLFALLYPRLFNTARHAWRGSAMRFALCAGLLAWSYSVLPVAAKYRMSSWSDFLALESAFTALQFLVVAPLIAFVWRAPANKTSVLSTASPPSS